MKTVYNIFYYLFIAAVLSIALVLAVSILPIPGNYKVLIVKSGSMEPTIRTGSIVITKPQADYAVNDIITFGKLTKTETPVTHRIVEVKDEDGTARYVTKGDANQTADLRPAVRGEIIGRVLFGVPYAGYAVDAVKQPIGFILVIVIPALLVIFDELKKIWVESRRIILKNKLRKENNDEAKTP